MGLFARNQITWDNRPKCPPIEDCGAKNARTSMPTRKQQAAAARLARQQQAARQAARAAKKNGAKQEPEPKRSGWPFAGSYNPKQERGRGR